MRNYFSKCSEVHLKINFIIIDMEVYLVKLFRLNIHEATGPNVSNLLRIFNFFSTKTNGLVLPQAGNVRKA